MIFMYYPSNQFLWQSRAFKSSILNSLITDNFHVQRAMWPWLHNHQHCQPFWPSTGEMQRLKRLLKQHETRKIAWHSNLFQWLLGTITAKSDGKIQWSNGIPVAFQWHSSGIPATNSHRAWHRLAFHLLIAAPWAATVPAPSRPCRSQMRHGGIRTFGIEVGTWNRRVLVGKRCHEPLNHLYCIHLIWYLDDYLYIIYAIQNAGDLSGLLMFIALLTLLDVWWCMINYR